MHDKIAEVMAKVQLDHNRESHFVVVTREHEVSPCSQCTGVLAGSKNYFVLLLFFASVFIIIAQRRDVVVSKTLWYRIAVDRVVARKHFG